MIWSGQFCLLIKYHVAEAVDIKTALLQFTISWVAFFVPACIINKSLSLCIRIFFLRRAGHTARLIGLNFFVETHWWQGGGVIVKKIEVYFFQFFSLLFSFQLFFTRASSDIKFDDTFVNLNQACYSVKLSLICPFNSYIT